MYLMARIVDLGAESVNVYDLDSQDQPSWIDARYAIPHYCRKKSNYGNLTVS